MKKYVKINNKAVVIKTREKYAPKEKVVKMKTKYNRKKEKFNGREYF